MSNNKLINYDEFGQIELLTDDLLYEVHGGGPINGICSGGANDGCTNGGCDIGNVGCVPEPPNAGCGLNPICPTPSPPNVPCINPTCDINPNCGPNRMC